MIRCKLGQFCVGHCDSSKSHCTISAAARKSTVGEHPSPKITKVHHDIYHWKAVIMENSDMGGVKIFWVNELVQVKVKGQGHNAVKWVKQPFFSNIFKHVSIGVEANQAYQGKGKVPNIQQQANY